MLQAQISFQELQLAAKRAGSSPEAADVVSDLVSWMQGQVLVDRFSEVFHWLAAAHNVKDVSLFRTLTASASMLCLEEHAGLLRQWQRRRLIFAQGAPVRTCFAN